MATDDDVRLHGLEKLYRIGDAIASADSLVSLIAILNGLATDATGAANVAVGAVHRWQRVLDVYQGDRGTLGTAGIRTVDLDEPTPLTDVVRSGAPQLIGSWSEFEATYPRISGRVSRAEVEAMATFPLVGDHAVIGAMFFRFDRPTPLDGPLFSMMTEIATLTSRAVARILDKAELEARAASLERSNDDLREFAAIVAHDLSGPVRRIGSFARLIERRTEGADRDVARHARQVIDQAVHLDRLLKDVLSYSQVSRGAADRERIELVELAQVAWDQAAADHPEVAATLELVGDLPALHVQTTLVRQVFVNVFDNSFKYRDAGRDLRVEVTAERARSDDDGSPWWRVTIADNGRGLDQSSAPDAFTIFRRLATAGDPGGTGVGLAFVKRVVEHHGGEVSLAGKLGAGVELSVTLPGMPVTAEL